MVYDEYVDQLSNLMVVASSDENFQTFLPGCIVYAQNRLYRDLNLLESFGTEVSVLSSGVRTFSLPDLNNGVDGTYEKIVINSIAVITPVTADEGDGTRNMLVPTTPEFIDMVYPSAATVTGVPQFYARIDGNDVILGPSPDRSYNVEVRGTFRPESLSAGNEETVLTERFPELFIAASMVFASGYMRDFGGQTDNPAQAQSWENQYKLLFQGADVEEARRQFKAEGWTSQNPSKIATPPRV